jgi:RNA polymerase sigma-70 factor (ECF subfamily)
VADLERHGSELYLALGSGLADVAALEILQRCYLPPVEAGLVRSGFGAAVRQDVFQQLLLYLCTGDTPRILGYGGRAALTSWLHVITFRLAVQVAGKERLPTRDDAAIALQHLTPTATDPEMLVALENARPILQTALQKTIRGLPERDRTLLRLSFLDGLSIDAIGRMYGVHRASAARWICDIRQRILLGVRDTLDLEFGIPHSEFESFVHLVYSELHLSLRRLLGAA